MNTQSADFLDYDVIHFVQAGTKKRQYIHIGVSDMNSLTYQVTGRLKPRSGNAEVLGIICGGEEKAAQIRDQFKNLMVEKRNTPAWGGWYNATPELLDFIQQNADPEELKRFAEFDVSRQEITKLRAAAALARMAEEE